MYTQGFTDYQNFSSEPYNSTAEGEYAELQTLVIDGGHANGVSSLHFDNREGRTAILYLKLIYLI